jgi:hypothetical protein
LPKAHTKLNRLQSIQAINSIELLKSFMTCEPPIQITFTPHSDAINNGKTKTHQSYHPELAV